jgi:hypothetical protein
VTQTADRVGAPAQGAAASGGRPGERPGDSVASIWVRGAFAALWATALGVALLVVVALIVWAVDSRSSASAADATRFAGQLWLLAHRTPTTIAGAMVAIPPLGLTLLLGLLVVRASAIVARTADVTGPKEFGTVVAAIAIPYAVLAAVLAFAVRSTTFEPQVGAAFVCALLVGGVGAAIGVALGAGLIRRGWAALPEPVRTGARAAGVASAILVGGATVLTLGSLAAHAERFSAIASDYIGTPGELCMLGLSIAYAPNAVVFGLGYLTGPGFAIGRGASVTFAGSHLSAVPALPLVAGAPGGAAPLPVVILGALVVGAAGAAAGWMVLRNSSAGLRRRIECCLGAAAALGIGLAALAAFAGGPAGPGRLSAVGPSPWQLGLAVAVEVAIVAMLTVLVGGLVESRAARRSAVIALPD